MPTGRARTGQVQAAAAKALVHSVHGAHQSRPVFGHLGGQIERELLSLCRLQVHQHHPGFGVGVAGLVDVFQEGARRLRLIRSYLNAGIMDGGVVVDRHLGTPQGGPLSPLLANVLLDEVDKALEARGYSFARYADDCNVYVGSIKAGERVMAYLRKLYTGLKLQINEAKSAVASAFGRKFLGYALWVAKGREVKCKVAEKPLDNFKARIRQLTRRSGGRSMAQVVEKLRPYLLGWKAYFGMSQTPKVWRGLDEWLRHRLRAIQLRHWKRPKAIYRELKALGASEDVAKQVAGNCHRWWRNSDGAIKRVLTIAYFDRLGVPRLS